MELLGSILNARVVELQEGSQKPVKPWLLGQSPKGLLKGQSSGLGHPPTWTGLEQKVWLATGQSVACPLMLWPPGDHRGEGWFMETHSFLALHLTYCPCSSCSLSSCLHPCLTSFLEPFTLGIYDLRLYDLMKPPCSMVDHRLNLEGDDGPCVEW